MEDKDRVKKRKNKYLLNTTGSNYVSIWTYPQVDS